MLTRRDLIKGGVALVSLGTVSDSLLKGAVAFAAQHPRDVVPGREKRAVVLVQLAGGNDGLRTVVPYGDPAYRSARRTIAMAEDAPLAIGEGFGLHPALKGLKAISDGARLAVVRGVGYPDQDYSHFKSMAIWQAGDPALRLRDGWLGRTLEQLEGDTHDPFLGFNVGTAAPAELRTPAISVPSVSDPADYQFRVKGEPAAPGDRRTETLVRLYEQYPSAAPHAVLLETTAETAVSSSRALATAGAGYRPAVDYPETSFGTGMSLLAEVIVGDLGMRVGHITLGGFDTHANETDDHDRLMSTLDEGLSAFFRDLEAHGRLDDVLVLTWSEFGRRVAENANGGTDHGAGSVLFAFGGGVRGGLYGDPMSLTRLVDGGNLAYTTDFRRVYATVIESWMGVPHAPLMGGNWDQLGFCSP